MERSKLLSEINTEIIEKELSELQPSLTYANTKRSEHGFVPFEVKQKFSFFKFFLKFSAVMTMIFIFFISFLFWKFTPIFKVDEQNNRVTILGGLIDIDGKSGKFKIFDDYHFSDDSFTNDLQASIALPADVDEIIVEFSSGSFSITNSDDSEFKLDCKLAMPATKEIIKQMDDFLKIDLTNISGSTCELKVPEDKKLTLEGKQSSIRVLNPEFNLYVELENGKVAITPEEEIDYLFNLEVTNGYIGDFESSEAENAYEIQGNIGSGSISTK
jgi:hypothetical protein